MYKIISPKESSKTGEFYWLRVTSYVPGATLQFDQQNPILVDSLLTYEASLSSPWKVIALTGTITVDVGSLASEKFPGNVSAADLTFQSNNGPGQIPLINSVNPVSDLGGVSNPALFDVTSAVNTSLDTGILDVSLWRFLFGFIAYSAGGGTSTDYVVDDAGASLQIATPGVAAGSNTFSWGPGCTGSSIGLAFPLPRRVRMTIAAVAAVTSRLRLEGRR